MTSRRFAPASCSRPPNSLDQLAHAILPPKRLTLARFVVIATVLIALPYRKMRTRRRSCGLMWHLAAPPTTQPLRGYFNAVAPPHLFTSAGTRPRCHLTDLQMVVALLMAPYVLRKRVSKRGTSLLCARPAVPPAYNRQPPSPPGSLQLSLVGRNM